MEIFIGDNAGRLSIFNIGNRPGCQADGNRRYPKSAWFIEHFHRQRWTGPRNRQRRPSAC